MKSFVKKWIGGVLLMFLSLLNLQAQTDTLCNPNENKKLFSELYLNYGSASNVYSSSNRSTFILGQPLLSTKTMLSQANQAGFGVYSAFLMPPLPPLLVATQGDFKDRVRLSWTVNPLSSVPTGFSVFRDGSFLFNADGDVFDQLDLYTQAGEYYQYSIVAKNAFGSGSPGKAVGFVNPNGVVSGKISTNSGNPVPGVEVRLMPLTGASMAFDGVDDELCVSYNDKFPTDKFTVSAYVKFNTANNETGIIDWGSTLKKNWWITTTKSNEARGYIFHVGNGTGSDSLKYYLPNPITNPGNINSWHQITMIYNGSALSVMVDGEFVGTKPASISRTKNYLNIGSNIGNGGFFKGNIDDVRIYNRPLTQTEVQSTKNRSVSKTENGLVAYWKMDEGVGQKVFDSSQFPTNANIYGINAKFSSDIPEVYNAGISDVTGYYAIDGINYSTTESFRATPMKNFEFNSAIEFNAADKSYGDLTNFDIPDTATVEVLFYPFDLKSRQTVLSKDNLYELYVDNSKLYLNLNGKITDLGVIKAKYYHVAVAMNNTNGTAKVYLEGELSATVSFTGTSNWATGNPWLIATNSTDAATGKFYTGLIDEFAIYKTALPQNQIQQHFVTGIPQDSTTKDLFTYFDLNEGSDIKVYDYAAINFGAALPREGILTKANWSNNARRKQTNAHAFEPNVRVVNLNNSNTAVGSIDFKDVSTVNVSGTVRFANTFCFSDSVQIYSNGQPLFPPVRTDKKGRWSVDFEPGANIKLTAKYGDHLFSPAFTEFRKLQSPKAGVVFLDNTKRTIRGQIAGGKCRSSIIPANSRVIIKVATTDGCFVMTDTVKKSDGIFVFKNLPARNFTVSVIEHSNSVIYNYFQGKGGQIVDLRDVAADTVDFIYIAPPQVEIAGIDTNKCGFKTVGQNVSNKIGVKVFEQYYGEKCYLDNMALHIDDASSSVVIDTTLGKNVYEYIYRFNPINVNTIPPYLQTITVTTTVNSANDTKFTQFAVLGLRQKGKTFTASSPQIPDFILRDPPGDASYAVLEKGSTICNTTSRSVVNVANQEVSLALSIGGTTVVGGFGVAVQTTNKLTASTAGGSTQTWTNATNNSSCLTTTKTITTSPGDIVVGSMAGGDVYVGKSESVTYGAADLLNMDFESCKFTIKQRLTINSVRLATDFVYSENYIVNSVLPALLLLSNDFSNPKRKDDSSALISWKKIISDNKNDKSPTLIKTISFDAGAVYEESENVEDTNGWSYSFDGGGFVQAGLEAEIDVLGGFTAGATIRWDHTKSNAEDHQKTASTTITYHLEDNDPGDNYLINLYKGSKYGTYIFDLVAGESSCPWEKGTKPRSEPSLISDDGNFKSNVPANTAAVFTVELGNLSPTKEQKEYELSLVPESNPDGAIVKANGQIITQSIPYMIPYGQNIKVLVTVEKGPIAYNYNDIQIQLESACETAITDIKPTGGGDYAIGLYGGNFGDSLFVRTLNLGVQFIEPCSPVDISFPLQGWVVTPASGDKLTITLNEYRKSDVNLKLIRVQYRPVNGDGSWINIKTISRDSLGEVYTLLDWSTNLIKDGDFEIRAVAECYDATKASGISTVIRGSLARIPPELVGVPEPGDGTWDPGDEISITFDKLINCDKVIQADVLSNNTIGLYDATTNKLVDAKISCVGNKIVIVPNINPVFFENRTFRVEVSGKDYDDAQLLIDRNHQAAAIRDKAGNMIPKTIKWEFAVNQNNLEWVGTDVIETNEVLKPFSVKRQIRNRGGSIASFRMEGIPSWLTVTPSTGTLNPGQVADVTLIFQQDLLIGDYLDTLNMVGSRGAEPLLIDYRVRCPQPKYEVVNPEQYQGTMNMVVDLSIFGVHSTDPSDVIVAKIGGQIRGVGRVAYFRNIPADKQRWLTFLTIYGNSDDEDKPVEFTIWDGRKCNEYIEILENYAYRDGSLVGSPLVPTPVSVLNLVKKCIPLNRGFNWVSFNLNLGTGRNTVSNMLSSLKNKTGAYIKTDNSFAQYLPNYGWDALDSLIYPTKRYMVFVLARDTVCIKGAPYEARSYPIAIKNSWNWIGYVPSAGMTVTQALRGLTPLNGDIIKSQTLFAQYVAGVGWIGNLSFLEPLKGYLLKISNAGTLTYPTTNSLSSGLTGTIGLSDKEAARGLQLQSLQETPMTFDYTQYEQTMNLIGKVNGMEIDDEDELRAYIDGVLVGTNKAIVDKKERLFFQTIYYQDEQNIQFKLFKADRNKEFSLDKSVVFKSETLVGLVENPVVFNIITSLLPPVTIKVEDNVIKQPVVVFPTVSIPASIVENTANCLSYSVSTILPLGTETKPTCLAPTLEANMSTVIKIRFNERTGFVSDNDVLTFINPVTNAVLGCATFNSSNKLFYGPIAGPTGSVTFPVDVKYYSNTMKKSFTLKSAVTYKVNDVVGNALAPYELDIAPLRVSISNGIVTAAMRDTSWTGSYGVNVFALNCSGYSDGQATFNFYRLKSGDCLEVIDRKITDIESKDIQAVKITSQATINAGFNINYQGGNLIELNPGFDARTGAIFKGQIGGCNNK